MDKTINICLACDDNYAQYAGVVIASVISNAEEKDNLQFYILDGGISEEKREKLSSLKQLGNCNINFIKIREEDFEDYKQVNTHPYLTLPAFYRLKLTELLPNINRVIYFDCDVVVNSSLRELFDTEMGDLPIAGVHDIDKKDVKRNPTYVNSGVLVMDLKNMRAMNCCELFLEWTKNNINSITKGDQEIINSSLKGKIKVISNKWNVQSSNFVNRSSFISNPKIIHFVAKKKPWHYGSYSYHKDYYFKYLQITPWKLSEKDYTHWTRDNKIYSILSYLKYRPLFLLRPKFYYAIFKTYIMKEYAK